MAPLVHLYSTDARLVRRVLGRDVGAFEFLVARHQKRAIAVARSLGVRSGELEDVVQESFLRALEKLSQLRAPDRFRVWFLQIVRNVARRTVADQRVRGDQAADDPAEAATHVERLEQGELRHAVRRAVDQLPESVRETVYLYYYEARSVRAVASSLGVSRAAVLKRLERGRNLLRAELWKEFEETLRDAIPGAREWERRARRVSVVVLSSAGLSLAGGKGALAATGAGTIKKSTELVGGVVMTKKTTVAIGIAVVAAIGLVSWLMFADRGADEASNPRVADIQSSGDDLQTPVVNEEAEPAAPAGERVELAEEQPAGGQVLRGVIRDEQGRSIEDALVLTLPTERWQALAAEGPRHGTGELTPAVPAGVRPLARLEGYCGGGSQHCGWSVHLLIARRRAIPATRSSRRISPGQRYRSRNRQRENDRARCCAQGRCDPVRNRTVGGR